MKKHNTLLCVVLISLLTSLINAQTVPTLLSPVNGSTNAYTNQTFTWSSIPNAVYRIQISIGSGFWWNQVDVGNLTTNTYQASGLYMYTPYYWRVSATTESGTTFSSAWQFTTGQSAQSSGGPTLVFPANNATGIQITNTFQWNAYSGATSYRLQVSGSSSFTSNQVDVDNITATSYQVAGLYYSTNYYWRVGANTSSGIQYSDPWQFTTGLPGGSSGNPGPVLISPTNSSTGIPINSSFTWDTIQGATYRIQISTSSYFGYNQVDVSGLTSPIYNTSGLYMLTPYYWRVNATTSSGTTDWSTTFSFTTGTSSQSQIPSVPALASPANGSTNILPNTSISWNTSQGASTYGLQVATDNQFNNLVVNITGLTALSYNLTNLNETVTYYWRVNAANSSGTSPWSSIWSFTTEEALPVLTVTQPSDSLLTNQTTISIVGNVLNTSNTVKINGNAISVNPDGSFSSSIDLIEGSNTIQIVAYNNSGDSVVVTRNVTRDTALPVLTIISPVDSLITNQTPVTINGTINEINAMVIVNGDTVSVDQSGNFSKIVNLVEGLNVITINAVDAAGNPISLTRIARLDTQKPILTFTYTVTNITPDSANVTINGTYNDSTDVTITINNLQAAEMSANSFTGYVTLLIGQNTVTIVATDEAGNTETVSADIDWNQIILPPDPITVATPIDSTIVTSMADATEFLYTGDNPIQTGVSPGAIDKSIVSVIRGKVLSNELQPLPGVEISIFDHPELGITLSRMNGQFDIAVNGGDYITINYKKEGYLPIQRQIKTPWQDYALVDSVVLVQLDINVTEISTSDSIQTARGSIITDQNGTRQATLLFRENSEATIELIDGSTQVLNNFNVRATEYTVGENGPIAMPAQLPPNVGYTYCVELSLDEAIINNAKKVVFNKPVTFYLENFIGFPVGSNVPVGYYDRFESAEWVPMDDGRVIKIVEIVNDRAEIDIDGDNIPEISDTLLTIGIDSLEQKK